MKMHEVEVCCEDDFVLVRQGGQTIRLDPDQVDIVRSWLKYAALAAKEEPQPDESPA